MKEADAIVFGSHILTMDDDDRIIEDGAVVIQGRNIIDLGGRRQIEESYTAREIIDGSGCLVMPGLINGHTHAAMTYFRGLADDLELMDWLNNYIFPAEARFVNREFSYLGTLLACAEMIKSGTTTFCDMYIFEDEIARAAKEAGMRCLLGEVIFDFPSPNTKTPEEGLAYTEMLIKKWAGDPLVNIVVEPHSLYTCSDTLIRDAKILADRYGVFLATHYLETDTEYQRLVQVYGRSPSHFLDEIGALNDRFLAFHCVFLREEDIRLFADRGCSVIHNPESNMKLASGVAPVPDMLSRGVTVGLGTDGCASNNNLDMFQEMDSAAKLHKVHRLDPTVMDAPSVLKMATRDGARALGMDDTVGRLKTGAKADLLVIDLDKPHLTPLYNLRSHLVYAVNGSDVKTVLIDGRIVMRDRKLLTIDEGAVMENVNRIAGEIRKSLEVR
ncbi:MAG: amidohydrolase [Deltaproteobacteria bacterium]|nr:amidohydrolase [Deltaproteobacteria bacterium]